MKRNLLFGLLLIVVSSHAQNFEGSITWTVEFQMPDSAAKQGMAFVFPKEFSLFAAGNNWLIAIEQGYYHTETTWQADSNQLYKIDRQAKTYSRFSPDTPKLALPDSLKPVIEKTKEAQSIQGYPCKKYIVHLNRRDTSMLQIFWVTTAIKIKGMEHLRGPGGKEVFYAGMDGIPLRVEVLSREMKLMIAATSIKKGLPDTGMVKIPAGFKKVEKSSE